MNGTINSLVREILQGALSLKETDKSIFFAVAIEVLRHDPEALLTLSPLPEEVISALKYYCEQRLEAERECVENSINGHALVSFLDEPNPQSYQTSIRSLEALLKQLTAL